MDLPRKIKQRKSKGNIFLHTMPGVNEDIKDFMQEILKMKIYRIFCLSDKSEMEEKSPHYLEAVYYGHYGDTYITYNPSPEGGIPRNEKEKYKYERALIEAYNLLKAGNVLIHCTGGIGRTGTFAIILLRKLGFSFSEALELVKKAGSVPESENQLEFSKDFTLP